MRDSLSRIGSFALEVHSWFWYNSGGYMLKPRIQRADGGGWRLRYNYPARSFWLFGLEAEERRRVSELCVAEEILESWPAALVRLRGLYIHGLVVR